MRILLVGAGGVGTAFARIAARRAFAELVIGDYDLGRAQRAAAARDGYEAVQLDARDEQAAAGLLTQDRCDVLMNTADPRFVMPLFRAALQAGTHYLDMAMSLSYPIRMIRTARPASSWATSGSRWRRNGSRSSTC
jgi:saccharopine dehydrogenase-like NADP-dependent oxidoreductase